MRFLFCFLLFQVYITNASASKKAYATPENKALQIVKKNAPFPDDIRQLLVVFNESPEQNTAVLVALEKKGKDWLVVAPPFPVGIGRKGFAAPNSKREGDNQSPTGFFRLGQLFCYDKDVDTRMPFIQTTPEDKWIDDPNSPEYNRHVRGETQANSYEKLKIRSDEYKYCMVIEYNTHPVVKGMGSAIFIHLSEGKTVNPSSGCVVLIQKDMEWLLKWLKPELKPWILMGNDKVLSTIRD